METKEKIKNRIRSVTFEYVGTEEQFVTFLKSILRDYIDDYAVASDEDAAKFTITEKF